MGGLSDALKDGGSSDAMTVLLGGQVEKEKEAKSERQKSAEAQILAQEGNYSKPAPEFQPTQESASGFAALGALLAASGAILGSNGKSSGLMAMNAVSGMMNGYNSGRKDLYEQQRQQFEEHMKSWERNRTLVKEAFDRAMKIAPYNLTLAQQSLNKDLVSLGMQPLAEMNAKSGPVPTAAAFQSANRNIDDKLSKIQLDILHGDVSKEDREAISHMPARDQLLYYKAMQAQKKQQDEADKAALEIQLKKAQIAKESRATETRKDFLNKKTGELKYMTTAEANKNPDLIEVSPSYVQTIAGQKATDERARLQREATEKNLQYRTQAAEKRQTRQIEAAKDRTLSYLKTRNTASPDDIEANAQMVAHNAMKLTSVPMQTRQAIATRAKEINPSWSEADYGNQSIAYRNWVQPNGFGAKQLSSFSTVAQHLDLMDDLNDALDNQDQPAVNAAINFFKTQLGHPEVTDFNTARQAVASELVRAYSGTAGALDDRKTADQLLNANLSPDQVKGVLNTAKGLIGARLFTAKSIYESGTGRTDFDALLPGPVKRMFGDYIKDKGVGIQGGAGAKTAEERFNELIDSGSSEDDAYKTLAKEGYK